MRPALALLLCLAGCTAGPDFQPPQPPTLASLGPAQPTAAAGAMHGGAQSFASGQDLPATWWELFRDPQLDALVRQALRANPSIEAAQAALRQARENVRAQQGAWFPSVSAALNASRNLTPTAAVSPASASGNPAYSLVTPQLSVSFVPDVFGANTRAVESLQAQAESQRFQAEAVYLTLTTNVVTGVIQDAALRGQIQAAEESVNAAAALVSILQRQVALGQAAGSDLAAQEALLAQARQALPPLRKQLNQQRDALAVLIGALPSEATIAHFELDRLTLPTELPLSLPSAVVAQRPDIRQAEENLHAASAQFGQAVAARLPQITLTGDAGASANRTAGLFNPGTAFWTLVGGVTAPVFDGFSLLHRQRAAEAAFDQAAAQYKSTVLTAFQNVADALHALQADADALAAAVDAERAADRSLTIVRRQLELGQVAYLALLNAQQTLNQARITRVQAQAARLTDTVALFQALGGGWWNRAGD